MLARVLSCGLNGIDGFSVDVEVNLANGIPMFEIVGLPDTSVRESRERVRAAVKNSGYGFPAARVTVNLAPADLKKEGPSFDLPIALGALCCCGILPQDALKDVCIFGELSLDGSVRPVRGALPMTISMLERGVKKIMLPKENLNEVSCIEGAELLPVESLAAAVKHFTGQLAVEAAQPVQYAQLIESREFLEDFRHVKGQSSAKRALEIAAAGGHNVLMIGPPGSGKTLMARCMPSILPDMTFAEALESTRIHSVAGSVPPTGLLTERPFRSPHHTASHASLVGGGINALPGEISKAHNGVLFLDELPEYRRDVLEALRQPLEDGFVTITRVGAQATYPARFVLICSMNPCPCGHLGSRTRQCRCTPNEIRRYLNKISGPLLDRIDMHIEIESIPAERLADLSESESSDAIRARVSAAREIQRQRYTADRSGIGCNAHLDARTLAHACTLTPEAKELMLLSNERLKLSNRAYTRILKVARTIADLEGADVISAEHVSEAVQYRTLDRKYWGVNMDYTVAEQYWIWLSSVSGIGVKRFYQLLSIFEDPQEVWDNVDAPELKFLGEKTLAALRESRSEAYLYRLFASIERAGCRAVPRISDDYPALLAEIYDPPATLYVRGDCPLDDPRMFSIVGSRRSTRDGQRAAREIAAHLARENVTVVSGMARGIDTCAHEGALSVHGRTIAVLGCGVDVVYPPENDRLMEQILEDGGAVISEYIPGTRPLSGHFPARNRIISGLTPGTLLVEGAKGSGAMITINDALDQNRDVFAVPGSIYSPLSAVPNQLIVDGAKPVISAWEILDFYRWAEKPEKIEPKKALIELDETEKSIVLPLMEQELSFEELTNLTEILPSKLNSHLTMLELRGIIVKVPGGMYRAYPDAPIAP